MSEHQVFKLLDNMDKEYINIHKNSDTPIDRKFSLKAHFVIGKVKKEFKKRFEEIGV